MLFLRIPRSIFWLVYIIPCLFLSMSANMTPTSLNQFLFWKVLLEETVTFASWFWPPVLPTSMLNIPSNSFQSQPLACLGILFSWLLNLLARAVCLSLAVRRYGGWLSPGTFLSGTKYQFSVGKVAVWLCEFSFLCQSWRW